jgi:threonine dehydrogenase-like Zn-dependent dehydrogenase
VKKALGYGPRDLRLVDLPERRPAPGEASARMLLSTLTTANLRLYLGNYLADIKPPVTLSYTGVGQVEEVGDGVTGIAPGDLVYPNFYRSCNECRQCKADRAYACERLPYRGHNMMVGEQYESGLQEQIVLPAWRLRKVPKGTKVDAAALIGFASVSMHGVSEIDPPAGETVFISGAGPIGWGALQIAKMRGCRVVMTEIKPDRRKIAEEMGADAVVDASASNLVDACIEACGGRPYYLVEATGVEAGSRLIFDLCAKGARIAVIGVTTHPITQHDLINQGLSIFGIGGGTKLPEVIELVGAGKIDLSAAISHRFPLSQLREAFEFKISQPEARLVAVDINSVIG